MFTFPLYNWKVSCFHKDDVFIGFDIVAGLMFPTTMGRIEVLPDVTYGFWSIFDLLPVSCFSGNKFDLLQVN